MSSSFDDSEGVEPNNALKQFSLHANVNVTPSAKLDFSSALHFVDLRANLGTDAGASIMYGANYGHRLFPGLAAARGFAPGIAPEFIWELWDNSQKVRRFTTSNTISHRPNDWFSQRLNVGLDFTSDDGRNLERFASPALQAVAPAISGVAATGRITQFLRNTNIFSLDYSGSARADLTTSVSATTSLGLQTFRTEAAASRLGGTGFAGAGVETISATALPTAPHTGTDHQHDGGRVPAGEVFLARSAVPDRRRARGQQQRIRRGLQVGDVSQGGPGLGGERGAVLALGRT